MSAMKVIAIIALGSLICSVAAQEPTCFDMCELNICESRATCVNHGDGCFECLCPEGFTGQKCETVIPCTPECQQGQCRLGECDCNVGWTGEACETPVPCYPDCGAGYCDGVQCTCPIDYTGSRCETPIGCAPDCGPGTCINEQCECPPDFTGSRCQSPISGCNPECVNGFCNEGRCVCFPPYTGEDCSIVITPGTGYSCDEGLSNYACTQENIDNNVFLFPYEGDCSKYVQCVEGPPIQCFVKCCPEPLIWDPFVNACNDPTPQYNCTLNPPDIVCEQQMRLP